MKRRGYIITSLFLISVLTFLAFCPIAKNEFVNWDDDRYITDNPAIHSVSLPNLRKIFTSFFVCHYQPVTIMAFLFEYRLFGMAAPAYHLISIAIHLLNCLLVFWLIFLLARNISVPLITTLLFGLHPLQVESVAWASETKNLLYAFFFLGAMISYIYYIRREEKGLKYYFLSYLLFILSILSKSPAVMLPLVFFILDYFLHRKVVKKIFIEKIPYFILSLIFGAVAIVGLHSAGAIIRPEGPYGPLGMILTASYCLTFYLNKLLLPFGLSVLYPFYQAGNAAIYIYAFAVTGILAAAVIFSLRYTRKSVFGAGFFLVNILPCLQFIMSGEALVCEHHVYLPSVGIFYLFAEGFLWMFIKKAKSSRVIRAVLLAGLLMLVALLCFLTRERCGVWQNSVTLWSDVIKKYPEMATPYNSRGAAYLQGKEYDKALPDLMTAIKIDPFYCEAYFNLCSLNYSVGNHKAAIGFCEKALTIDPSFIKAYNMLSAIYGTAGDHSKAIELCGKAINIDPDSAEAYAHLCSAYGNQGNMEKALDSCKMALAIDPDSALAHANISAAYYHLKEYDLAIKHCDKANRLGHKVDEGFLRLLEPYRRRRRP